MKTSRIPQPALERFGLFAIVKSKRVVLPLKGVECDFSVVSGVTQVSMTQIFRQENEKALDCEYLFPLPADASVFSCEADINGRIIRAQVREREEARKLAAEKKAAGFRTALVESERDNLFTLSLGNVQPEDLVIVRLKYFQLVRHSLGGGGTLRSVAESRSIEIPFCPGIRYIPGKPLLRSNRGKGIVDDTDEVPDASRITPVRIDAEHPDAAYIEVRGTLDGQFVAETSLTSPSHPIAVYRTGDELRISLSDKADVPDRDFVLRWTERETEAVAPRVWLREKGAEVYALLEVRAPKKAPSKRAPVDFYFLVDRSGSMQGEKWNKAADALQSCMRVLGSTDRAMITFFESRFQDFAVRPLLVRELIEDQHFQSIERIGTGGGTEMRPALKHVLDVAAKHSRDRDKNLILITDAQIGNESAILDLMKAAPDLPVHCFGIDVALNDSLLLALTRQQGGTFHSLNPKDNIQAAVTTLGQTLGLPVLLDLKLSDGWEIADARIPNLYAGQIHYLSARSTGTRPLELTARTPSSETVRMRFENQTCTIDAPYLHWCRSRIQRLIAEGEEKQAVALSVRSNLICTLTAFVAWDESEKVTVASHELVQPSMAVAGAQFCLADVGPMRAAGAPAASLGGVKTRRSGGGGLFREFFRRTSGDAMQKRQSGSQELKIRRELSDLCHRAGVPDWQPLVTAIFDWIAKAPDTHRSIRVEAVCRLFTEIQAKADRILKLEPNSPEAERQRTELHQILKSFVDSMQPAINASPT